MGAPAALAPPGGTDGRGARSALHHHPIQIRFQALEHQPGEFCATRSNAGTDGSEAFAVGAYQRGTTGREAGLRYSAGRAQRGRVVPLHL
jgi:hypothetical protein